MSPGQRSPYVDLAAQLATLREEFRHSLPGRLAGIEKDLGTLADGWDEPAPAALAHLRSGAHRLAGAAGTFGMPALSGVAHDLEALLLLLIDQPECRDTAALARCRSLFGSMTEQAALDRSPVRREDGQGTGPSKASDPEPPQ